MNTAILGFNKNPTVFGRRFFSLALALILAVLTISAGNRDIAAASDKTANLSAEVTELSNGNYRVDVKLGLPSGVVFNTLQTKLEYSSDIFTVVSYENTSGLAGSMLNNPKGVLAFVWNTAENACDNSETALFSAVFSVKSGVSSGKYDFTLTDIELFYGLEEEINVKVSNASVSLLENLTYITGTASLNENGNYTIEIFLTLPSNESTSGMEVALTYDQTAFEFVKYNSGNFSGAQIYHNGIKKQITFVYDTISPYYSSESALLFSAEFSVKDTAVSGNYGFDVTCNDLLGSTPEASLEFKTVSPAVKLIMKKISSDIYRIKNGYIGGIEKGTTAETVIGNIHSSENISIQYNGIAVNGITEVKTNMDIILTVDGTVADRLKIAVNGDVNGDGAVDIRDLVRLKKYIAGVECNVIELAAELNGKGSIEAEDLVRLRKLLFKK